MKAHEVETSARLEGTYSVMRKLQAIHDTFTTRCIGSGNCCKIGLRIHLTEAWNIARNLRRSYWLVAEDKGLAIADNYWEELIQNLKEALVDPEWDPMNEEKTSRKCVFFGNGCTIYEFRPFVCRAYGVIGPVQDGVCPRKRLPDGGHELIRNDEVDRVIEEMEKIIDLWVRQNPNLNYSLHIAAGVLRFLLPQEELMELINSTDQKFWLGVPGYPVLENFKREFETPVKIERKL